MSKKLLRIDLPDSMFDFDPNANKSNIQKRRRSKIQIADDQQSVMQLFTEINLQNMFMYN